MNTPLKRQFSTLMTVAIAGLALGQTGQHAATKNPLDTIYGPERMDANGSPKNILTPEQAKSIHDFLKTAPTQITPTQLVGLWYSDGVTPEDFTTALQGASAEALQKFFAKDIKFAQSAGTELSHQSAPLFWGYEHSQKTLAATKALYNKLGNLPSQSKQKLLIGIDGVIDQFNNNYIASDLIFKTLDKLPSLPDNTASSNGAVFKEQMNVLYYGAPGIIGLNSFLPGGRTDPRAAELVKTDQKIREISKGLLALDDLKKLINCAKDALKVGTGTPKEKFATIMQFLKNSRAEVAALPSEKPQFRPAP